MKLVLQNFLGQEITIDSFPSFLSLSLSLSLYIYIYIAKKKFKKFLFKIFILLLFWIIHVVILKKN
jgi:hypothetical protein